MYNIIILFDELHAGSTRQDMTTDIHATEYDCIADNNFRPILEIVGNVCKTL